VSEGIHENLDIANYTGKSVHILLELAMRSDFADLFEVKTKHIIQRGKEQTQWNAQEKQLYTTYDDKDFHRAVRYHILDDVAVGYANGRILFEIELAPNQHWHTCAEMILEHGQQIKQPDPGSCHQQRQGTQAAGATPGRGQQPRSDFDERQAR
jgi:glycogen debranching enzyme